MAQDSGFMTASTANDFYLNHEPRGAQTMTTKQNDAAAMTEEQLDGVSGGPHIRNYGVTAPIQQRRSNRTRCTEMDDTGFTQASRPVLQMLVADEPRD